MDLNSLGFEIERRVIIFHRDVSMADETQLGYTGSPNNVINGNTQGETLLYNCPSGTIYLDKGKYPYDVYQKVEDIPGGLLIKNNSDSTTIDYISVIASDDIGGHRAVVVFDNTASYADNISNFLGQLAITLNASSKNTPINVKTNGVITDSSFNFSSGPIYLSINGLITQEEPINNAVIILGLAQSTKSFLFNPSIIIER